MAPLLVLLFFVVPIAELVVVLQVADAVGVLDTIGLLILISLVGAWLVKREGLGAWRRVQKALAQGRMPGREVVDGAMILVGGAFLLTPGFLTDAVGLLLLLPPVRAALRRMFLRRAEQRIAVHVPGAGWVGGRPRSDPRRGGDAGERPSETGRGPVIDVGEATIAPEPDPDERG